MLERVDLMAAREFPPHQAINVRSVAAGYRSFEASPPGHLTLMLFAGIALIALGIILGFVFPVMFVAAVVGVILLIVFFVAGARRAKEEVEAPSSGVDTLK